VRSPGAAFKPASAALPRDLLSGKGTTMATTTVSDAYAHYLRLCGGRPVLSEAELRVEVRSAGLGYEELDEAFWLTLFRRPDHRHLP
jgi:hypothetical protein